MSSCKRKSNTRRVAGNLQWGGGGISGVWGRSPLLPDAVGGLGVKFSASGDWRSGPILITANAVKTWHKNLQC